MIFQKVKISLKVNIQPKKYFVSNSLLKSSITKLFENLFCDLLSNFYFHLEKEALSARTGGGGGLSGLRTGVDRGGEGVKKWPYLCGRL